MHSANATCVVFAALALLVGGTCASPSQAAHAPPLTTRRGVVAADDPTASEVGAAVLGRGGNAVDAAVATAFALGVVNPTSSGIGGGGFALVYVAAEDKVYVHDFREVAPAAITAEHYRVDGVLDTDRSRRGGLAVAVPGEVAGLEQLWRQHGVLSWRRLVAPAARLARDGFDAGWFMTQQAPQVVSRLPAEPPFEPLRGLLAPGGVPLVRGDRVVRDQLAAVLLAIGRDGRDAFYRGPIADDLVATASAAGGVLTADDLAGYQVVAREPLWGTWRGLRIATMPLPSSGGLVLLEALGILDALEDGGVDLAAMGPGSSAALHVTAELLKHGFADRARLLGDTDDARAQADVMLDPAGLRAMAARIDLSRTAGHDRYGHGTAAAGRAAADGGTSHVCVVDDAGNAVALTTTVNGYFGSKLVTATGVVLNNEMDDFAMEVGVANGFGLVQSERNLVAPGKRPLSSMTPVLVLDADGVVGCAGGSGGPYIISNVLQVLLDTFVFGLDVRAAVEAPRIHHQWDPDELKVEAGIPRDVVDGLARRGHKTMPHEQSTAVQAIRVLPDGAMQAASDPRKNGAPAAP